jgi:hypothetical protein
VEVLLEGSQEDGAGEGGAFGAEESGVIGVGFGSLMSVLSSELEDRAEGLGGDCC